MHAFVIVAGTEIASSSFYPCQDYLAVGCCCAGIILSLLHASNSYFLRNKKSLETRRQAKELVQFFALKRKSERNNKKVKGAHQNSWLGKEGSSTSTHRGLCPALQQNEPLTCVISGGSRWAERDPVSLCFAFSLFTRPGCKDTFNFMGQHCKKNCTKKGEFFLQGRGKKSLEGISL